MSLAALQKENESLQKKLAELQALAAKKAAGAEEKKEDAVDAADKAKVDELFKFYDADNSGFIDHEEFNFLAYDLGILLSDEELLDTVKQIDTSGDNKISSEEFYAWYKEATEGGKHAKAGSQYLILASKLKLKVLSRKVNQVVEAAKKAPAASPDDWTKTEYKFEMGQFEVAEGKVDVAYSFVKAEEAAGKKAALGAPGGKFAMSFDFLIKDGISAEAKVELGSCMAELNAFIEAKNQEERRYREQPEVDKIFFTQVEQAGKLYARLVISLNIDPIADLYRGIDISEIARNMHFTLAFRKAASALLNGGCLADFLDFKIVASGESNGSKVKQLGQVLRESGMFPPELLSQLNFWATLKGILVDIKLGSLKDVFVQFEPAQQNGGDDYYYYDKYREYREVRQVFLRSWDDVKEDFIRGNTDFYIREGAQAEREGVKLRRYYNWTQAYVQSVAKFHLISSAGLIVEADAIGADFFAYLQSPQVLLENARKFQAAGAWGYDDLPASS